MRPSSRRRVLSGESGFTITELLVSSAIMLVVTGAIFSLMNPAQGSGQAQPEVADVQQRMRVGSETLFKELVMAGAGTYQGPVRGSLNNYFAPILPRRTGFTNPDAYNTFRTDAITLTYVPNTYSQTTISQGMPISSAELKVTPQPNCPQGQDLCGFSEGMSVLIFDSNGNFDAFTITQVQDQAGHLQHRGQTLSAAYDTGASITQAVSNTYWLDRTTHQLKQYDGYTTDVPLVDNVVDLRFDYFGDINPPTAPKPGAGVANCLYDAAGNPASLPVLTADEGSLAHLTEDQLTDGPWCGGGTNQFDADLLRIRKVRLTLRVQAANAAMRGKDTGGAAVGSCNSSPYTGVFMCPGTAKGGERFIPDYTVTFDISPRNLNLAR